MTDPNISEGKRSIVVVDDDEGLLILIQSTLEREGYEVAVFTTVPDALEWLKNNDPSLMLLDLNMPVMGGKELLGKLKEQDRSIPFIVITGQGDERVAVGIMKEGALDYLVKDVAMLDFLPSVVSRVFHQIDREKVLVQAQAALKESQKQILSISEHERQRFGADLHDSLGQELTAIELMCQSLKVDLEKTDPQGADQAVKICQFLRSAIAHTRSIARGLSPIDLDKGGLPEALADLACRTSELGMVKCNFYESGKPPTLDPTILGHLFRIAQESINNAVKHAHAAEINISLESRETNLILSISDNGKGFLMAAPSKPGMGLQVMKHRANVIGASLTIDSGKEKGTVIRCVLPFTQ